MLLSDIPVSISNINATLSIKETDEICITARGNGKKFRLSCNNMDCVVATPDKMYLRFSTPVVCNPRSRKPKSFLVFKSDQISKITSVLQPHYNVITWNCKEFLSIGYEKKLYISPPQVGVIFIAASQEFVCLKSCEIERVQFLRTMPGTRSFDVALLMNTGEQHLFENVDKSEMCRLLELLSDVGIAQGNDSDSENMESVSSDSDWEQNDGSEDTFSDCSNASYT